MLWENMREEEFDTALNTLGKLCVIPLGCLEKHGQHLPVGTDTYIAQSLAESATEIEDVVIFPAGMWLGEVSCFHAEDDPAKTRLRGCIGLSPKTLLTVLEELCDEIARNGFEKILILNSHGGNVPMLDYFIRAQCYNKKDYATMWTWANLDEQITPEAILKRIKEDRGSLPMLTDEDIKTLKGFAEKGFGGDHADFRETALIMAEYPSLVAEDRYDAESGESLHAADYLYEEGINYGQAWISDHPNSYSGYPPYGCTETIGQAMMKICTERLVRIFRLLKNDNKCVEMAKR